MNPLSQVAEHLGSPHMELTWEDLERYRGHIVYVWTREAEVLYVGASFNGLERPIAKGHERLRDFQPGDRLTIWRVPGGAGALYEMEAALIRDLRPRYNYRPTPCPGCGGLRRAKAERCVLCPSLKPAARASLGGGAAGGGRREDAMKTAAIFLSLLLAGCATAPTREYRSGVFLHRQPTYSFQVPDGWRPATEQDVASFGYLRLSMKMGTPDRQRQDRERARATIRTSDSVLVSERGAVLIVQSQRNGSGVVIPPEHIITEPEKAAIIRAVMQGESRKEFTIESADLVSYGRTPALKVTARAGGVIVRMLMLTSRSHLVMMMHIGIPGEDDEGLPGLDQLATSFQFDQPPTSDAGITLRPAGPQGPGSTTPTLSYPGDLRILRPSGSVAGERAAFSGHWLGAWNEQRSAPHALVVEQVEDAGAVVVFAGVGRSGPVWGRHRAKFIDDGGLRFTGRDDLVVTYRAQPDGTLFATMEWKGQIFRSRMTRRP